LARKHQRGPAAQIGRLGGRPGGEEVGDHGRLAAAARDHQRRRAVLVGRVARGLRIGRREERGDRRSVGVARREEQRRQPLRVAHPRQGARLAQPGRHLAVRPQGREHEGIDAVRPLEVHVGARGEERADRGRVALRTCQHEARGLLSARRGVDIRARRSQLSHDGDMAEAASKQERVVAIGRRCICGRAGLEQFSDALALPLLGGEDQGSHASGRRHFSACTSCNQRRNR
jgi:hypothetical protein